MMTKTRMGWTRATFAVQLALKRVYRRRGARSKVIPVSQLPNNSWLQMGPYRNYMQ